jgi:hypothetical protein
MQFLLISIFLWVTWSLSGIIILCYSVYINNYLLIITSSFNVGLSIIIFALKSWEYSVENCIRRQVEEYDTEFDYEPGYDYTSKSTLVYKYPYICGSRVHLCDL